MLRPWELKKAIDEFNSGVRYEPVSKQVSMIETRLRDGRAMLTRDNVEMRKLYEQVESQQLPIQ